MPRASRVVDALFGYGWMRDLQEGEFPALVNHLPVDLSATDKGAAQSLLAALEIGSCNLDDYRRGVFVCRQHLSPEMVGVKKVELVFVDFCHVYPTTSSCACELKVNPFGLERNPMRKNFATKLCTLRNGD